MRILIVSTDKDLSEDIQYSFAKDGEEIRICDSLTQGLLELSRFHPDFCLVGDPLPDGSVLDFMRGLEEKSDLPVIAFGDHPPVKDIILCLEYGCVDYMRYPINLLELKARMRLALRLLKRGKSEKAREGTDFIQQVGEFQFHPLRHDVYTKDGPAGLTLKEFEILFILAQNENKLMDREQLTRLVWERDGAAHIRTIDVYVRRLRRKLKRVGVDHCIETKWGKGYIFLNRESLQ